MDDMKRKLNEELKQIQFSSNEQVLNKIRKESMLKKAKRFLNREVEIPLVPITGASLLLIVVLSIYPMINESPSLEEHPSENKLIEKGGSLYWESMFNEVKQHES